MSRHDDVSCDSCLDSNFTGKRFKCLVCYDYDLCGGCFDRGATSGNHCSDHPMQCLLTPNDIELYYGSENVRQVSSYTCPLCGRAGYSASSLRSHVLADHAFDNSREVICPICVVTAAGQTYDQNHFTDEFALHIEHDHRSDSYGGDPLRARTESEGSSGELRTVLDRQMARRGTGRIASRSSRASSSRLNDPSSGNNEERSLIRGRGIFRERESRDRTSNANPASPNVQAQQQQPQQSGLRLVANLRTGDHGANNDPLAELLNHMANSRAVIYDSNRGSRLGGTGVVLAPGGGTVAQQLEQQLQSARSLLEELQHLERLPNQRGQVPVAQGRGGVVLIGAGGHVGENLQQAHHGPATVRSSANQARQSQQQSALSRWCDERERQLGVNAWNMDDARFRALFVQEVLLGLTSPSSTCKETVL